MLFRSLEDEALAVVAEIRLGVLTAVGQLSNVTKVCLTRFRGDADRKVDTLSRT